MKTLQIFLQWLTSLKPCQIAGIIIMLWVVVIIILIIKSIKNEDDFDEGDY
jgi:hypothetical protein